MAFKHCSAAANCEDGKKQHSESLAKVPRFSCTVDQWMPFDARQLFEYRVTEGMTCTNATQGMNSKVGKIKGWNASQTITYLFSVGNMGIHHIAIHG